MSEIFDLTGDGIADTTSVDTSGDGIPDAHVIDANQDQVADAVILDGNHNGVDDRTEDGLVGGYVIAHGTNEDPAIELVYDLVAETGQPVFGPGDRDSDGYNDNQDAHPGDPFRA